MLLLQECFLQMAQRLSLVVYVAQDKLIDAGAIDYTLKLNVTICILISVMYVNCVHESL